VESPVKTVPAPPRAATGTGMADDSVPTRRPGGAVPAEVADFLRRVAATPAPVRKGGQAGRLMFALDATASRQPTWDSACRIQSDMFAAAAELGGLEVQLVFYRGFGECRASPWVGDAADLARRMGGVSCLGGQTQIGRVLAHAAKETGRRRVNALVFVGDACEENPDRLCHLAGELGLLGVPAFVFHEGGDPAVRLVFQQIARLSGGAYCPFDAGSAAQLKELLRAVAVFAAGGRAALENHAKGGAEAVLRLTRQLGKA